MVLWLASGRSLIDFIKFGRALASSTRRTEDVSSIDPEILASCIQDLRMGDDLSMAYRQMDHIPLCIVHSRGADTITKVDLTECGICDLSNLSYFTSLELLVLDKNKLEVRVCVCVSAPTFAPTFADDKRRITQIPPPPRPLQNISTCPKLLRLHTLWCNNNRVTDLDAFLKEIAIKFPNIYHLSIMRNPVTPEAVIWSDSVDHSTETGEDVQRRIRYHKYRLAVLARLPQIRILDDESVTPEEHAEAQEMGDSTDWIVEEAPISRDETDRWKWPAGYDPPLEWLRNTEKMQLLRDVQAGLDECGEDYRQLARASHWDINKRTISRYLEAAMWSPKLNGTRVAEAIMESIKWRKSYPSPIRDRELLLKGLGTGSFIVSGSSKDGWPIVYVLFHNDTLSDPFINAKCLLYTFERAIQSLPLQKQEFVLLIDTKGFGYNNVPPIAVISEMSEVREFFCTVRRRQTLSNKILYVNIRIPPDSRKAYAKTTGCRLCRQRFLRRALGVRHGVDCYE